MRIDRRAVTLALIATPLVGCARTPAPAQATTRNSLPPDLQPQPNAGYDAWLVGFRGRAIGQGLSPGIVENALRTAGFLPGVVQRDRNQTEFRRSFEDYLAITASDEKIATGRARRTQYASTLARIEQQYGVPPEIVVAIWGVESNYGARRGTIPVVSSASTLAFDGRRGRFFESQLIAALRILQSGDTTPQRMVGSWAGAMGHTQFIPTSYLGFAVDFTGDGRRDIWADDPTDALASTAAYLQRSGWQRGARWADEAPGGGLTPDAGGPSFRTGPNFRVIKRYNNSDNYALGVGHLADRIAGGGPLRQAFGPDRFGLTIDQRRQLQTRLTRQGFDTDGTDGVIGPKTEAAIRAYQAANGLAVTGTPSLDLLVRLG